MADILSQEEIDKLLEAIEIDDECTGLENFDNRQISLYDFKRPTIAKEELKINSALFNSVLKCLINKLNIDFNYYNSKDDFNCIHHSSDVMTFGEYLLSVTANTVFALFEYNDNKVVMNFELNKLLAFADIILGGNKRVYEYYEEKYFVVSKNTEKLIKFIFNYLIKCMNEIFEIKLKLIKVVMRPELLNIKETENSLYFGFELIYKDEEVNAFEMYGIVCIPLFNNKFLYKKKKEIKKINKKMLNLELDLNVYKSCKLNLNEFKELKEGDILELKDISYGF